MKIKVGNREVQVLSCSPFRYQSGKLVLNITVQQSEIGHDTLKALLKNNTADIIRTNDDGKTETFSGFSYTLSILDRDDVYECEVECISETERMVLELQNTMAEQAHTINSMIEENKMLSDCLIEMSETVYA